MRKKILITISDIFLIRDLFHTGVTKRLISAGADIYVLVPESMYKGVKSRYEDKHIIVLEDTFIAPTKFEAALYWISRYSLSTDTIRIKQGRKIQEYEGGGLKTKALPRYFFFLLCWYLGKTRIWREFVRALYWYLPTSKRYEKVLDEVKPDVVFPTDFILYNEFNLLKTAKKKYIPNIGIVRSWDNLSSKVFLIVKPDCLITYNEAIKREAIKNQDINSNKTILTGIAQYDLYFDNSIITSREDFCRNLGLDPKKRFLFYCCSSSPTSPKYEEIFSILKSIMNQLKNDDLQLVIRPYPKYPLTQEVKDLFKDDPNVVLNEKDDIDDFVYGEIIQVANILYHSSIVMSTYTTLQLEACFYDKPIITVNFDGFTNKPYYYSVRSIADYNHYKERFGFGWMKSVNNKEEWLSAIKRYLSDPSYLQEGRKKLAHEQAFILDGKSWKRLSDVLMDKLQLKD